MDRRARKRVDALRRNAAIAAIAARLEDLSARASAEGEEMLAYLIDLARQEAEDDMRTTPR